MTFTCAMRRKVIYLGHSEEHGHQEVNFPSLGVRLSSQVASRLLAGRDRSA